MPSEYHQPRSQSQSHSHPPHKSSLGGHRPMSSVYSPAGEDATRSPSSTPPQHNSQLQNKPKGHIASGGAARLHKRVPSSKGLFKPPAKTKGNVEGSHENLKRLGKNSSSTTSLKKNTSQGSLRRNDSSADVVAAAKQQRPKSSHTKSSHTKRPTSTVHFEIGNQDDDWEEASSSASPSLSRSASRLSSRSGQSSAKPSTDNSRPHSPSPLAGIALSHSSDGLNMNIRRDNNNNRSSSSQNRRPPPPQVADAEVITERLLQRVPSTHTTMMSLATATPSPSRLSKSSDPSRDTNLRNGTSMDVTPVVNGIPRGSNGGAEVISRFVGDANGTPNSPFLLNRNTSPNSESQQQQSPSNNTNNHEEPKRARSMGDLSQPQEDTGTALAPSRKSSTPSATTATTTHAYNPPQQSRTQQKLWLQRASSNIEPQQMTPGGGAAGYPFTSNAATTLVGGYEGRGGDPRIKLQLEKTGLEYLVVRRYQDPVGTGLKRLGLGGKGDGIGRTIDKGDKSSGKKGDSTMSGSLTNAGQGPGGVVGSTARTGLRDTRGRGIPKGSDHRTSMAGREHLGHAMKASYDSQSTIAQEDGANDGGENGETTTSGDDKVSTILRSIWEKSSFDLSVGAD